MNDSRIFYQLMELSNLKMYLLFMYMLSAPGSTLTGCNTLLPIASATDARPSATGTAAPRSVYCYKCNLRLLPLLRL